MGCRMRFVIGGMKYDTDKMERVAAVKKWYREDNLINRAIFPGQEAGRTREEDFQKKYGEAIEEEEAKALLMRYATETYESMFGELPEA